MHLSRTFVVVLLAASLNAIVAQQVAPSPKPSPAPASHEALKQELKTAIDRALARKVRELRAEMHAAVDAAVERMAEGDLDGLLAELEGDRPSRTAPARAPARPTVPAPRVTRAAPPESFYAPDVATDQDRERFQTLKGLVDQLQSSLGADHPRVRQLRDELRWHVANPKSNWIELLGLSVSPRRAWREADREWAPQVRPGGFAASQGFRDRMVIHAVDGRPLFANHRLGPAGEAHAIVRALRAGSEVTLSVIEPIRTAGGKLHEHRLDIVLSRSKGAANDGSLDVKGVLRRQLDGMLREADGATARPSGGR